MMRKLRTLGLAFAAALAANAVIASGASAESFAFHSEVDPTVLAGSAEGTHQFTVDAGTTTCTAVHYTGTVPTAETTEAIVSPIYTGCTTHMGQTVDVSMEGCRYVLTPETKVGSTYKAKLGISCESGKVMKILVTVFGSAVCTIEVPPQVRSGVTISEVAGGDIKVATEISNLEYDQTGGFGCSTAENTTNGTYKGSSVIGGSLEGADATIAMKALQTIIQMPAGAKFTGVKTMVKIPIENKHTAKIGIKMLNFPGTFVKHLKNDCGEIDVGKSCTVELECIKLSPKGKSIYLVAESATPRDLDATQLEGCTEA
jgi:hypothetical protein